MSSILSCVSNVTTFLLLYPSLIFINGDKDDWPTSVKEQVYGYGTSVRGAGCYWVDSSRFSLYSGAAITKVLAVVVSLYYFLVPGSVQYPMPCASCLGCCGVSLCCVSLSCSYPVFFLKELCLPHSSGYSAYWNSACPRFFGLLQPLYLVHSHDALWDSLSRLMPSGIACLASQASDWPVAFWDDLSGLWMDGWWMDGPPNLFFKVGRHLYLLIFQRGVSQLKSQRRMEEATVLMDHVLYWGLNFP